MACTRQEKEDENDENAPWPHQFVEPCEAGPNLLMTDQEAFLAFIDESTRMLATETRRRAESH